MEAEVRSRWSLPLIAFSLAIPAAALAAAPFETPPQPDVPIGPPAIEHPPETTPPVAAPPFDLEIPSPSPHASLPDLPFDVPQGPPDPLPGADAGIPDLVGVVDLPEGALEHVLDQAPPFGGDHGRAITSVPEPATGALITLGLAALGLRKRKS
jgi:PEP-CTERM motif